jgi:CRISPR-associated protein Cas2
MFIVVCYDIFDDDRRLDVSQEMENFGERVQKSVFECHLNEGELQELRERLARIVDLAQDRVRFYRLCPKDARGILVDGKGEVSRDLDFRMV